MGDVLGVILVVIVAVLPFAIGVVFLILIVGRFAGKLTRPKQFDELLTALAPTEPAREKAFGVPVDTGMYTARLDGMPFSIQYTSPIWRGAAARPWTICRRWSDCASGFKRSAGPALK